MQIKDVMSRDFKWITPDSSISDAAYIMKQDELGFLPVGENDRLIGTVTDRDIVVRSVAHDQDPQNTKVRDVMTPQVLYCYEDQTVDDICQNMSDVKVRRLPVLNKDKRMVGIVSLGDLAQAETRETGEALQHITEHAPYRSQAA